ncbi:hypothetical protein [Streptomyces jumonjinensis]|uniref:hypothetical protein n=1 Tax=Streptomyces jumonjinensis TaxID=1945 RepID=UPI0037A3A994
MIQSSRTRRTILRDRARTNRATARITRRGAGTLATHCIAAGLRPRAARSVAGTLRKTAAELAVTGTPGISYTKGRARTCTRYTRTQVAQIAIAYRPRKPAYKIARVRLTLAA